MLELPPRRRGADERGGSSDFHPLGGGTITAEERKRQHELVSSPPSSSRVGRWRTEMSAEDRKAFEEVAGKLLVELGYEVRALVERSPVIRS